MAFEYPRRRKLHGAEQADLGVVSEGRGDRVRPPARHRVAGGRPVRDRGDAGVRPRGGGGVLRPAGPAGDGRRAHVLLHRPGSGRLARRGRRAARPWTSRSRGAACAPSARGGCACGACSRAPRPPAPPRWPPRRRRSAADSLPDFAPARPPVRSGDRSARSQRRPAATRSAGSPRSSGAPAGPENPSRRLERRSRSWRRSRRAASWRWRMRT